MSGFIEIYKIDPIKIKENLYPKLINSELEEVFIPGLERMIGNFKQFFETNQDNFDYRNISYEKIIQKLENDNPVFEYNEFSLIIDWVTWYYNKELDNIDFLDENGLISIGSLHSRFESSAFFGLGCQGINDYLLPVWKPDFEWNDASFPLNHKEFILMIDYMVVLCVKVSSLLEDSEVNDMIKDFQPKSFNNITELEISTEKQIQSYLSQKENFIYKDEMQKLFEGYHVHFAYVLMGLKKDLSDYEGVIYKDDCY
jgi:hypothetical protein